MTIKQEFRVNGVSDGHAGVQTEVDGETVRANVPCLEVELIPAGGRSGSFTLRAIGANIEDARKVFTPGAEITATFEPKGGYENAQKEGAKK